MQNDSSMNWSANPPVPVLFPPHFPPAKVHMPLPYVPLPQMGTSGNIRSEPSSSDLILLNYSNGQPLDLSSWNRAFQAVFLFEVKETLGKDTKNINKSLMRISNYIKNHLLNKEISSGDFVPAIKSLWDLINTIYTLEWNRLLFNHEKKLTINKCITHFFSTTKGSNNVKLTTSNNMNLKENTTLSISTHILSSVVVPTPPTIAAPSPTTSSAILPSIKNINTITKKETKSSNVKKSYVQAFKLNILPNIKDVL